jgi:hypothetical protein
MVHRPAKIVNNQDWYTKSLALPHLTAAPGIYLRLSRISITSKQLDSGILHATYHIITTIAITGNYAKGLDKRPLFQL